MKIVIVKDGFEEKTCEKLKEAWNKFLDDIAIEWHLHDILDWIDKKIK